MTNFFIDKYDQWSYINFMTGEELKTWRKKWGKTQGELARMLGTYQETISRWERDKRGIPSHLSLALEALENRLRKEAGNGSVS